MAATHREIVLRPEVGGCVRADIQRDGRIDLSLIAPEGPSAAVYVTDLELCGFALDLLALLPMESGHEIGELIEERRAPAPVSPGGTR